MPSYLPWAMWSGGILCLLLLWWLGWRQQKRLQAVVRDQAVRNAELSRMLKDQEQAFADARNDNKMLSGFLVVLPDIVRHLNTNSSRRAIPPLLSGCLEQLFEPAQVMVFLTQGENELMLVHGRGLPEGVERGVRIRFGQGRIGLTAEHQRTMDREAFLSESRFRRAEGEVREALGVTVDLVAPMVNEGRTLGVLALGNPARRHRDDKRMLKLVADLGALALVNQRMFNALELTANRDSLTGLGTKRFLNVKLGELIHRSGQSHEPLSLLIFDIDHFKRFNDTHGHLAGDECLKKVAALVREQVRADDIPARYGGEEFVVVLPNTVKEDALRIADKLRKRLEDHVFDLPTGRGLRVTISGGVASLMVDGTSTQELLAAADRALYAAKEAGRNRVMASRNRYLSGEEADSSTTRG
jgi:diguanylate cyclase (GGDEF)-like protein